MSPMSNSGIHGLKRQHDDDMLDDDNDEAHQGELLMEEALTERRNTAARGNGCKRMRYTTTFDGSSGAVEGEASSTSREVCLGACHTVAVAAAGDDEHTSTLSQQHQHSIGSDAAMAAPTASFTPSPDISKPWWEQKPRKKSAIRSPSSSSAQEKSMRCFVCRCDLSLLESESSTARQSSSPRTVMRPNALLAYLTPLDTGGRQEGGQPSRQTAETPRVPSMVRPPEATAPAPAATTTTAPVSCCSFCERAACSSCISMCEACEKPYCSFCITTDYSMTISRSVCWECCRSSSSQQQEQESGGHDDDDDAMNIG